MLRHLIILLFSFVLSASAIAQVKLLQGRVYSAADSTVLPGVHIANLNSKLATNSFLDGTFLLPYQVGDSIRLSSIGYEDKVIATHFVFIPNAIEVKIFMREKVYQLPEVDISIYRTREDFERAMLERELQLEDDQRIFYQEAQKIEDVHTDLNAHVSLGSPVSFLYGKFSKEAREQKKVRKAVQESHRQKVMREKYNHEVVMRVTGITDPFAAKMLVKRCPMKEEFLYVATEYDVVKHILDCVATPASKAKPD